MKTPLFEAHTAMGARMVDFAGWDMPLLYKGIIPEHQHTRSRVSIFDICHMGELEISGPAAAADLDRLLTQPVAAMRTGACSYGYMLDEKGGVLDDLICFRLREDLFWLVVNAGTTAGDIAWLREHLSASTSLNDLSPDTAKIDIQGPQSLEVMARIFPGQFPNLKYFHFQEVELLNVKCLLSRTGYTGEWGYELYLPAAHAVRFWEVLTADEMVEPAGLGARDTLRMEMGYPLYGHELGRDMTPAGIGAGRFIDFSKEFIGRAAVQHDLDLPETRQLAGLLLEGRMAARPGDHIVCDKGDIGIVTSGLFAPSLNRAAAMAYVGRDYTAPGTKLTVVTRGKQLPAEITTLPFYKQGTARKAR